MATSWGQRGADWRGLCPVLGLSLRSREKQGKATPRGGGAIKKTGWKVWKLEPPWSWHSGGVGEVRRARKLPQEACGRQNRCTFTGFRDPPHRSRYEEARVGVPLVSSLLLTGFQGMLHVHFYLPTSHQPRVQPELSPRWQRGTAILGNGASTATTALPCVCARVRVCVCVLTFRVSDL